MLVHPLCPYNFDFQVERQQLEDGVLVHPLCPYEEQLELFTCFAAAIREDDPRQIPEDLMNLALDARQAPFVPPSMAWYRPIGLTNLSAQSMTLEDESTLYRPIVGLTNLAAQSMPLEEESTLFWSSN